MDIKLTPTPIPDVIAVDTDFFQDERSFFIDSYHKRRDAQHGIQYEFVQDPSTVCGGPFITRTIRQ